MYGKPMIINNIKLIELKNLDNNIKQYYYI